MSFIKDEVYFVQDCLSKKIKIGYSSDFKRRFQDLSNMNANKLYLLGLFPGDKEDESKLHNKFAVDRTHGEWFNPSVQILNFIKEENKEKRGSKRKKSRARDLDDKKVYSVTAASKEVNLSRARFYQLVDNGMFPKPLYEESSKRPYYTASMLEDVKEVRITNVGVNGKICMFYGPRAAK